MKDETHTGPAPQTDRAGAGPLIALLAGQPPAFAAAPALAFFPAAAPLGATHFTGHSQPGMPAAAPRLMPVRARDWVGPVQVSAVAPGRGMTRLRAAAALAAVLVLGALVSLMASALAPLFAVRPVLAGAILLLFSINTLWIAWAAVIAVIGMRAADATAATPAIGARCAGGDAGRVAILVTLCGEDAVPVVAGVTALRRDLDRSGLGARCDIFVLSDTAGPRAIAAEAEAVSPLSMLSGVHYRRRSDRSGRKPGNIADWVRGWGGDYGCMAVLDADSRMTARRLGEMIAKMDADPALGLVQAGMRLLPASSRFGALQRLSARLCGPVFTAGLARWAGNEGNFWGHNALIRVAAFAGAAGLPRLPGRAPFGGDILSHDFIEAAWMRRAGWGVAIAPDTRGSFEDGPQTLAAFHRRDRRWCQGNLQHLSLAFGARMHGVSRVHLVSGIHSYLAAPIWLALVVLMAVAQPAAATFVPLLAVMALLMVPKLAGAAHWLRRTRHLRRKPGVLLRALASELAVSTLLAPLVLVRQSTAVLAVLAGRDCGWTPAAAQPGLGAALRRVPAGTAEAATGMAIVALALALGAGAVQIAWLAPLVLPLLSAPILVRWLDGPWRAPIGRGARNTARLGGGRTRLSRRAA